MATTTRAVDIQVIANAVEVARRARSLHNSRLALAVSDPCAASVSRPPSRHRLHWQGWDATQCGEVLSLRGLGERQTTLGAAMCAV
ncbi:hypothetical protein [Mycobacterium neglectum]|jgi:hypothetical protein|uniref:hypothetical protein n=1 Tax=Mycobacterium neglectum TaxID=242737 RepID=UPI000BFED9EE|nr:hypothetical protein [Mycobacterium neglectum]